MDSNLRNIQQFISDKKATQRHYDENCKFSIDFSLKLKFFILLSKKNY